MAIKRKSLILSEGAYITGHASFIWADILKVSRSGMTHNEVSAISTPGSLEFKVVSRLGRIAFDSTNPGNPGGESVEVIYRD